MNKIKEYIEIIKKNRTLIGFVIGALFVLFMLKQCNQIADLKQDVKVATQSTQREINNANAANDSVRYYKNKNGGLVAEIKSYEFDVTNLRDEQKKLTEKYRTALNLNKDLKNVNSLLMFDIGIRDSIIANLKQVKVDSLTTRLEFDKSNDFGNGNYRSLKGSVTVKRNYLTNEIIAQNPIFILDQNIKLVAAIDESTGVQQLKITTDYPGLKFNDIENINLINTKLNQKLEKKAGWSIGVGVGYGVCLTPGQIVSFGPTIGLNAIWSPKWLRFN
jgi:hypothetical protein